MERFTISERQDEFVDVYEWDGFQGIYYWVSDFDSMRKARLWIADREEELDRLRSKRTGGDEKA